MSETVQPLNAATAPQGLPALAERIKTLHSQVCDSGRNVVAKAIAAGASLIEAKRQVPHGGWLRWLKDNCELSERTAEDYMTLARNRPKVDAIIATAANMTLTQALRAIKGKRGKADDGSVSKYDKAQTALIKKLRQLPPEDVEDAANRTITELQEAVVAMKRIVTKEAA